jgi:hypothetical protein
MRSLLQKIWWLVKFALEKSRENSVFTTEEIDAATFYIDDFIGVYLKTYLVANFNFTTQKSLKIKTS